MKKTLLASFAFAALLLLSPQVHAADTLNLTLAQPFQFATPGSTLTFNATVVSPVTNGSTLFLNGDSSTVDFPLTLDDAGFFSGFPFTLNPGESFTGLLFTVSLPSDASLNSLFNGSFQILGGASDGDSAVLANVNFQVSTASPGITAVPEPSTYGLWGAAVLGLMVVVRRRFSASALT